MRQEGDIRGLEQGGWHPGLLDKDIEAGPGDPPLGEGGGKGGLVDHVAACGVDEIGRRFHCGEKLCRHHRAAAATGDMQRDDIGLGQDGADVRPRLGLEAVERAGCRAVEIDDPHPEAETCAAGDGLPDPAHAEDAEDLALQAHAEKAGRAEAGPVPAPQHRLGLGQAAGRGEDEREREIGRCLGQHAGGVAHHDPAGTGGLEVDVVHAHPEIRDDAGPAVGGADERRVKLVADGAEESVRLAQGRCQLRPVEGPVLHVQLCRKAGAEPGLDRLGKAAGDDDAGQ